MNERTVPLRRAVDELERAAGCVRQCLGSVFEALEPVTQAAVETRREVRQAGGTFAPSHLTQLRPIIAHQLRRNSVVEGMGFLAASDLFVDCERFLEWWRRDGESMAPLWLDLDPNSVDIYDYLEMEWFLRAQHESERSVFGPRVDYGGADSYVVTLTAPVLDERFLGVVGADVRMAQLESQVERDFFQVERDFVLVNAERRVILTNSERWTMGARLARMPKVGDGTFDVLVDIGVSSQWVLAAAAVE